MKLNYNWTLKDAVFTKDKGKVFSCFACGGGSTMGYKLAGFDVLGCNEIDPKMIEVYKANHNPKYAYLEPIQTFKNRNDLPKELYELDILDGSPPCSSFSMAGNREKDWGKEKIFREGQAEQILDTLFFDFIDLAKELQPKVVIAENVSGLMAGAAKEYVKKIFIAFEMAGYSLRVKPYFLDASKMGVPQKRKRVFFIAMRNDYAVKFMEQIDIFQMAPKLELNFNEQKIIYSEIEDKTCNVGESNMYPSILNMWLKAKPGECFIRPSGHKAISHYKINPKEVLHTIIARECGAYHYSKKRSLNKLENCFAGSFPVDYDFKDNKSKYLIGMSVPPIMTAKIANEVYIQWLSKINNTENK